ncbi:MAG: DNA polymerase I [Bacilli bacterium]
MKKIILIDGNSLMFRSYYATAYSGNMMQNQEGLYTNAIFAFCNMLTKLQVEEKTHLFVAFDAGKKTFRHQQFQDYKGTRKPLPDELRMQIPYIKQYLDILRIKRYEMDEYEADDLLATVAIMAQNQDFDEIKIITGDKDLLQLVNGNIKVFITRKGASDLEEFNEKNFFEKMSITPSQVPDYKGLVGDPSDNLPGIRGIGAKTALKLLNQFSSLESIISNTSLLQGKTPLLIEEGYKKGLECKELATLIKEIPLDFDIDDLAVHDFNTHELIAFFQSLGFDSFIKKLDITLEPMKSEGLIIANDYTNASLWKKSSLVVETFGSDYYTGTFLGIGLQVNQEQIFVSKEVLLRNQSIQDYLKGPQPKIVFDAKKIIVVLKHHGIELNGVAFDSLLAAYLIDPSKANEDFKKVADSFIATNLYFEDEVYGANSKAKIPSMDQVALFATSKAEWNVSLCHVLERRLEEHHQKDLLTLEINLSVVLADMELDGLFLDRPILKDIERELTDKQLDIIDEIYELAGERFNINSVKQLASILFEKLGIPSGKKNKTGFSTAVDVLEKLAPDYPIVAKTLEYRGITKIITTYLQGMYEVMDKNHYIHPLYKQALTSTGRLSSVSPNIQNMPIRTELGQVIRKAFISRFSGGLIMSSDYSQIELRILAHLSEDDVMQKMFHEQVDFHQQTAAQIYEIPLDQVTKDMRRTAKAINFGIIYGISAWGLSKNVGISNHEAEIFIDKYFKTFPKVKLYLEEVVKNAHKDGYTMTLLQRIRNIPELTSNNKSLVAFGERTAMNSPIQGSAADLIKIAMVDVKKAMNGFRSIMIAQVHDELLFDVFPGEEDALKEIVRSKMEQAMSLRVPLKVDIGIGPNWLET